MSLPDLGAVRAARLHAAAMLAGGGAAPADLWPELARLGAPADVIDVVRRIFIHDRAVERLEASRRNIAYGCGACAVSAVLDIISLVFDTGLASVFAATFGIGLFWIGRGAVQRWSGKREMRRVVEGVSDPHLLRFLVNDIDSVRDHSELMKRELMRARKLKDADRKSLYAGAAMAVVLTIVCLTAAGIDHVIVSVVFGLGAGFWIGVVAFRFFAYRAEGIAGVPLVHEEEKAPPSSTPASRYAVPRLDFLPAIDETAIIRSKSMDGTTPLGCAGGNEPGTLRVGVVTFSMAGIVFLPDLPADKAEALKMAGDTAWEIAKDAAPFLQIATAIDMGGERKEQAPSFPAWLEKSIAQPQHFVLPWHDFVEASFDPATHTTTLTRQRADGGRTQHYLAGLSSPYDDAGTLMLLRLMHDQQAIYHVRHYEPKRAEVASEVIPKFLDLYGNRLKEHSDEMLAEINLRTRDALLANLVDVKAMTRDNLGPALAAYAQIPIVRSRYADLFEDSPQKAAAS